MLGCVIAEATHTQRQQVVDISHVVSLEVGILGVDIGQTTHHACGTLIAVVVVDDIIEAVGVEEVLVMSVGAFAGAVAAAALPIASDALRLAVSMLIGAVLAGLVGVVVGVPVLRLNGDYLAIVTLAFGQIIKSIVENLYIGLDAKGLHASFLENRITFTDGGKMILNGPMGVNSINKISTFTAGFVLTMIVLIVIFNLVNSRAGRAIMALRDNRIAAESVGINVTKYKLMAFITSAAMAGAAGTLFALGQNTITASKFDFNMSILILVFVVLGGQGKMWGSILAATFLTVLPETPAMRELRDYRMLVYAIVMILVMLVTNSDKLKGLAGRIMPRGKGAEENG